MLLLRMTAVKILVLLCCCIGSDLMAINVKYAENNDNWVNAFLREGDQLDQAMTAEADIRQLKATTTPSTTTMSTVLTDSNGRSEMELQQQQIIHIVLIALVLHVVLVSVGFLIYCWCNSRSAVEDYNYGSSSGNNQWFGMHCLSIHHNYGANLQYCPCSGCDMARKLCLD